MGKSNFRVEMGIGADSFFVVADVDVAVLVIPGRNLVSPPLLSTNAPVSYIAHPCEVEIFVLFWNKRDATVLDGIDSGLG